MPDTLDMKQVVAIALDAGKAVMEIYEKDFDVEYKDDKSPLTEADKRAHEIISVGLQKISSLPILSEEGKNIPYEERRSWERYWCVDPIDGTKEFIKKNGEFTVNIALIEKGEPVAGVVFAPALGELYWAKKGEGAFRLMLDDGCWVLNEKDLEKASTLPLTANAEKDSDLRIVASKSHLNDETKAFIDNLTSNIQHPTFLSRGSSLKLVMVAEGSADIYPRLAPTMEWDTAAADAIVREAGKMTYRYELEHGTRSTEPDTRHPTPNTQNFEPLQYNKENLLNPWFVVR